MLCIRVCFFWRIDTVARDETDVAGFAHDFGWSWRGRGGLGAEGGAERNRHELRVSDGACATARCADFDRRPGGHRSCAQRRWKAEHELVPRFAAEAREAEPGI